MSVFIDTSAFYALLDASDRRHAAAARIWSRLLDSTEDLVTHNYILVETIALAQRRLGRKAVEAFLADLSAPVRIHWIDQDLHDRAIGAFRTAGRETLSLVDCVSFEVMRARSWRAAFVFDDDFADRGFEILTP